MVEKANIKDELSKEILGEFEFIEKVALMNDIFLKKNIITDVLKNTSQNNNLATVLFNTDKNSVPILKNQGKSSLIQPNNESSNFKNNTEFNREFNEKFSEDKGYKEYSREDLFPLGQVEALGSLDSYTPEVFAKRDISLKYQDIKGKAVEKANTKDELEIDTIPLEDKKSDGIELDYKNIVDKLTDQVIEKFESRLWQELEGASGGI